MFQGLTHKILMIHYICPSSKDIESMHWGNEQTENTTSKMHHRLKVATDLHRCNTYEPRHKKTGFCLCENKGANQLRNNCEADSAFVFATRIVHFLFLLNPKFQASVLLLGPYMSVCVRPGWKPRRPVFSRRGSYVHVDSMVRLHVRLVYKSRYVMN